MKNLPDKFYKIIFLPTGVEYMNEDRSLDLFTKKEDAAVHIKTLPECRIVAHQNENNEEYAIRLFSHGFKTVVLHKDGKESSIEIVLNKPLKTHTNPELAAMILRYWEAQDKNVLKDLPNQKFIVSSYVIQKDTAQTVRPDAEPIKRPVIMYSIAQLEQGQPNDSVFYLVFTDVDSFMSWRRENKWKPLQIDFKELKEIIGDSGIYLNPGSPYTLFLLNEDVLNSEKPEEETPPVQAEAAPAQPATPAAANNVEGNADDSAENSANDEDDDNKAKDKPDEKRRDYNPLKSDGLEEEIL